MKLQGKVAVITGAGAGIGRACAVEFAKEGAIVIAADINSQGAFETSKLVPGGITPVKVDVADGESVAMLAKYVAEKFGPADILVNNAAIQVNKSVEETTDEEWARQMAVNAGGVFLCTKHFLQLKKTRGAGACRRSTRTSCRRTVPVLRERRRSLRSRAVAIDHAATAYGAIASARGTSMPGWQAYFSHSRIPMRRGRPPVGCTPLGVWAGPRGRARRCVSRAATPATTGSAMVDGSLGWSAEQRGGVKSGERIAMRFPFLAGLLIVSQLPGQDAPKASSRAQWWMR